MMFRDDYSSSFKDKNKGDKGGCYTSYKAEWFFKGVDSNVQSLESHWGKKGKRLVITTTCGLP